MVVEALRQQNFNEWERTLVGPIPELAITRIPRLGGFALPTLAGHSAPENTQVRRVAASRAAAAHSCVRHGDPSRTCYVACGCRCSSCRDAATTWAKRFKYARSQGLRLTVSAAPVRSHLLDRRAAGMSIAEISRASGISHGTVRNIIGERVAAVSPATARALLAVRGRGHSDGEVPSLGSARRLQALTAIGWDSASLATALGWSPDFIRHLRAGATAAVHAATHARIAAAYVELSQRPQEGASAERARRHASQRGWLGPAAWDDDELDDPSVATATPTPISRAQKTRDRIEDVRDMLATGEHPEMIAQRLGVKRASVARMLDRCDRGLALEFAQATAVDEFGRAAS